MSHEFPQADEDLRLEGGSALRDALVACVNKKSIHDPDSQQLLQEWTKQNEGWAMAKNERNSNTLVSVAQALLYAELGFINEALEELDQTYNDAFQKNEDELAQKVLVLIGKIEAYGQEISASMDQNDQ